MNADTQNAMAVRVLQRQVADQQVEIDRLRAAFAAYGQHLPKCPRFWIRQGPCECGFAERVAAGSVVMDET